MDALNVNFISTGAGRTNNNKSLNLLAIELALERIHHPASLEFLLKFLLRITRELSWRLSQSKRARNESHRYSCQVSS